jgi:hypothetical protein
MSDARMTVVVVHDVMAISNEETAASFDFFAAGGELRRQRI